VGASVSYFRHESLMFLCFPFFFLLLGVNALLSPDDTFRDRVCSPKGAGVRKQTLRVVEHRTPRTSAHNQRRSRSTEGIPSPRCAWKVGIPSCRKIGPCAHKPLCHGCFPLPPKRRPEVKNGGKFASMEAPVRLEKVHNVQNKKYLRVKVCLLGVGLFGS